MNKIEPYVDDDGTLVIPFECSDHTHKYWKQEGISMAALLQELGVDEETWARYTHEPFRNGESAENSDDGGE
ncbi:hypothetical protein GM415_08535 [Pseudodesulfovibrio cashew]|uniref:Uncharacterized protein n=1 Tax=Pseudodesulfovibrio cashew TaxID=2678688 RepID=A0A6I6JIM5_9BACT|nr:hypothetical protein [Pseudodesulfovibrio cashew]QGY40172.1 hypothetical protein GM415_08535 [Pseudodesulfovibrio cashew]